MKKLQGHVDSTDWMWMEFFKCCLCWRHQPQVDLVCMWHRKLWKAKSAYRLLSDLLSTCSSRLNMYLEINQTVNGLVIPRSATCKYCINVGYNLFSAVNLINRFMWNPQQAMHVWTSSALKFNAIQEIRQMMHWADWKLKKKCWRNIWLPAHLPNFDAVIEMTGTCNWTRAD